MLVSDFIIQRLADWGVKRIFGYPGDGINGLLGALNRKKDAITFIQSRHEEAAAFMACAHAKFTDETGICLATSGPGAIHLLNGLYDAKLDHQPVVAIIGQQKRTSLGSNYQQEIDLISLFKDVASDYVQMISHPAQVRQVIDRALRIAQAKRSVVAVIVPNDLQEEKAVEEPPREHGSVFTGVGFPKSTLLPQEQHIKQAAELLNKGQKIAILIGIGAKGAEEEVLKVADLLGAGIAKALLGKPLIPDDLPHVTGAIGMLGSQPSWKMMQQCDTLFMIGTSFPYAEYLPKPGSAKCIQIDHDGKMLSLRYPADAMLLGDSKSTLQALIPLLTYKEDRTWRTAIEDDVKKWWQVVEERAEQAADPINPQAFFQHLSPQLPENCILTADSGTAAFWYARNIKIRGNMLASLSGSLATMCPSVPYAIAAKFAFPERPVVAIAGDGAMQMLCMNELITISKYYRQWKNSQLIVVVLNNSDLNMVSWEQRMLSGEPKFEDSQNIPDVDYAALATLFGLKGIRVEKAEMIEEAIHTALASTVPVVVDLVVDPTVPIIPGHLDEKTINNLEKALEKNDPESAAISKQLLRQLGKA